MSYTRLMMFMKNDLSDIIKSRSEIDYVTSRTIAVVYGIDYGKIAFRLSRGI